MRTREEGESPEHVWAAAHREANEAGADGYFDPSTGLFVMTEGFLRRRGTCCQTGCRHCPYGSTAE